MTLVQVKKYDLLFNVITPVVLGSLIYFFPHEKINNRFIKFYLADGLWAYALTSAILIIWDRTFNFLWICLVFFLFILVELCQQYQIIPGNGDYLDVCVYSLFSGLSFFLNKYLKPKN